MEIILVEDVTGVGQKGAVVNVKPGYARNYLLPRKLAISATANAGNLFKELERQRLMQEDKRLVVAREVARKLTGTEVNIPAAANDEDTLFGSVTESDIAEALAKAGHRVEKSQVQLPEHIKQLGMYDLTVRVYGDVTAAVKVWVVRP
jgi:large subunit ribosomal protein L9